MHAAAYKFVQAVAASNESMSVIEIGARNINGTARDHFPNAKWIGLDLYPGPCVDIVIDAEHYIPAEQADLVICCEVLEHARNWRELIAAGASWLKPSGRIIVTCAGPGRPEHSGIDGGELRPGEYYGNLTALEVADAMKAAGLAWIESDQLGNDTQALGWKPDRD